MPRAQSPATHAGSLNKSRGPHSVRRLQRLIAGATMDAYDAAEERGGLFNMIEEHLAVPFETVVLGVAVSVVRIDLTPADVIVAICERAGISQRIPLLDLPLPKRLPAGSEWIDAYRLWARNA